ncbi:MAG: hypothetical protein GEU83_20900 [Pseudonocardiaceae bacterium]|nr:hypothetical protein [Pseudonocardiaceae bacterium]
MRAGDVHVLDEQPHQLLALLAVELIDDAADLLGEVGDAPAEQVAVRECGALGGERGAFGGQLVVTGGDLAGASLQFGHVDQPGLEEVDEPAPLGGRAVNLAVQAGELGGKKLVVGDGLGEGDGLFTGQ